MSDPAWDRLEDLFHQARPLSPDQRAPLLDQACGGDPELRAEVERLLSASDRAGRFIHEPAISSRGVALPVEEPFQAGRRIGAWRLLRALGRGGMGAVYLAERDDGAYQQRVAIKLIKRGMDTDQVLARFRAERQILASLDHPNIARLLDGGTTDDGLPYLAMEYIEGRPIDTFAEAERLGVEQRLRLLLPVCDAVTYAHAQGVIHRDIKPLNTLVTAGGVPKLLDFGIAKVLQEAPGDITTVTGLRLLTPDYASPEQIEGLPATAASDVYSLGVVLYELLTGRSPYRVASRTPQEIAAAVRTTEPERPSTAVTQPADAARIRRSGPSTDPHASQAARARQLSRRLRGDLDTIVLTALRKEPARRYPSAAALADDIRRHLEGRPILARADRTSYRVGKFVRRHRALLGTAVLSAAAVTAAWLALASPARSADPTLLSSQALALRDRILVADFTDLAGDTLLAAAVTEAFRTDLSQSPVIRVMTPRQVLTSLARMQQPSDVALNDSLARELAVREGVKAFVTGSLARVSGRYAISVQLVAAQDGEALAAVRETASDSSGLIDAVDRASKRLRQRIGESLRDLASTPALHQATTPSLPALRLHTEAQRLVRQGRRSEAIARFEQAVALDTGFAGAYLGLSMAYGSVGDIGRSEQAGRRAVAYQARLPFVERSMLVGSRAYAQHDWETSIRAYSDLLSRFPDNIAALNNLALAYRDSRRYAVAESLFRRAAALDSTTANLLIGLHTTQSLQGKFAEGRATLELLARRFPDHPILLVEELQHAGAQQDWDGAERVAWTQIEQLSSDSMSLVDPYEALAQIAMVRGRVAEAERLWRSHRAVAQASGTMGRYLFGVLQRGYLALRYRRDPARAVAQVDSALQATPLDSLLPGDRRYDELARFYFAAGRPERGRALVARAQAMDSTLFRAAAGERQWTLGLQALAEGRTDEAIGRLREASEKNICPSCVLPDLGRAYEAAGRLREAADAWSRYLTTPWLWRYEPDAVELGWTLERLAGVAWQLGDTARARSAAEQLLALWKDADPELGSLLPAVRRNLRP